MTHTQTTCPNGIVLRAGEKGTRPAEVGALASMFEKSAAELKAKTKFIEMQTHNTNSDNQRSNLK